MPLASRHLPHSSGFHSSDACAPNLPDHPQDVSLTPSSSLPQPSVPSAGPFPLPPKDCVLSTTWPALGEVAGNVCALNEGF